MAMAIDMIKWNILMGASNAADRPVKKFIHNPYLATLTSSSLSAFALSTIPKYSVVPSLFPFKPVAAPKPTFANALILAPKAGPSPFDISKAGALACKTAQGALFLSIYNLFTKRAHIEDRTMPPFLAMAVGSTGGLLAGGTVGALRFPMEMYQHISPKLLKHPHASPSLYLKAIKQIPLDEAYYLFRLTNNKAIFTAAVAGGLYEYTKKAFPQALAQIMEPPKEPSLLKPEHIDPIGTAI